MADSEVTTASRISSQSEPEVKTPRFFVCETLAVIESGETDDWDDTDWQDHIAQFADRGVR